MNNYYLAQKIRIGDQEIVGPLQGINSLADVINKVIEIMLPLAAIVLLFVLISGGYDYLISQGSAEKIKSAKAKFTAGFIGFALLAFSYVIVKLVAMILQLPSPF